MLPDGVVSVGKVVGAVKIPLLLASIEPQVGAHVVDNGFGVCSVTVEEPAFGCTTSHFRFNGGEFNKDAVKVTDWFGVNPTGTVAVAGETETRMPESKPTVAVPVFLLSASAVAVKVSRGVGFGKFASEGAVYVKTFEPFVVVITHEPIFPLTPVIVPPLVQFPVTAVGLGCAVVGNGV